MKKKLLVVGKNSFYYSVLKPELKKTFLLYEISHKNILYNHFQEIQIWDKIIIFCRVRNPIFFEDLFKNYKSKSFILLSSRVLDLPIYFKYYNYYDEKFKVEKWFFDQKIKDLMVIRSGTIEGSAPIYSKKIDFLNALNFLKSKLVKLPLYSKEHSEPNKFYKLIFAYKYGYLMLRPIDLYYKLKSNYIYGYVFAIKKFLKPIND